MVQRDVLMKNRLFIRLCAFERTLAKNLSSLAWHRNLQNEVESFNQENKTDFVAPETLYEWDAWEIHQRIRDKN